MRLDRNMFSISNRAAKVKCFAYKESDVNILPYYVSYHLFNPLYFLQTCVKKDIGPLMVLILLRTNNACFATKELIKTSLAVQNANNVPVDIQLYRKLPPLKTIAEVRCLPQIHLQLIAVNVSIAQTY